MISLLAVLLMGFALMGLLVGNLIGPLLAWGFAVALLLVDRKER